MASKAAELMDESVEKEGRHDGVYQGTEVLPTNDPVVNQGEVREPKVYTVRSGNKRIDR